MTKFIQFNDYDQFVNIESPLTYKQSSITENMTVLLYIFGILLLIITFILVSQFSLIVDTSTQVYNIKWKGIAQANFIFVDQEPVIRFRVLGFKMNLNLFNIQKKTKKKTMDVTKKKESKTKKSRRITFSKMKRLLNSFTIMSFYIDLDTGDYIMNSYVFPIFYFLRSRNMPLNVNYSGHNEMRLIVENRLYKIIKAYLF